MLIPLTDPRNTYAAQMLRLIHEQRMRAATPETDRVHESRARTIVARAFARRHTPAASPSL